MLAWNACEKSMEAQTLGGGAHKRHRDDHQRFGTRPPNLQGSAVLWWGGKTWDVMLLESQGEQGGCGRREVVAVGGERKV